MYNDDFGKRVSALLQDNGLTQRGLAKEVGVTEVAMSRYISGTRIPNGAVVARIAMALHVSADYLLGLEGIEEDAEYEYIKLKQAIIHNAKTWTQKQKAGIVLALFDAEDY